MSRSVSLYLDLLRFYCAALVFLSHASSEHFGGDWLSELDLYGHDAVIVFFVLSGFVIAYVSSERNNGLQSYAASRLSRLYSVVVPALILTVVLDLSRFVYNPEVYSFVIPDLSQALIGLLTNLFFINEVWFESWRPFSNGPFWSISYEFWYYVIYAAFFYFVGVWRWALTLIFALIAGPKILILFPIWLLGVAAFHLNKKVTITPWVGLLISIAPLFLYLEFRQLGISHSWLLWTSEMLGNEFVMVDLKWSREFLSNYFVGLMIIMHLIGIVAFLNSVSFPRLIDKPIRYLGGMTFALYLFHFPLLEFYLGTVSSNGVVITVLTFVTVLLLAPLTEGRRKWWHERITLMLRKLD